MSYYDLLGKSVKDYSVFSASDVEKAIGAEVAGERDFQALLSSAAGLHLEEMAQTAHSLTVRHFGRTIKLYTPIYLSNYCDNRCSYCGFNKDNDILRSKLSLPEVEQEAECIAASGLKHILALTGDSRVESPPKYIQDCIGILAEYFSSISLEIYALTEKEYAGMAGQGVDGLCIYQETYDEALYDALHLCGPKKNYRFRLDAPERALKAGIRSVNIGALLGLNPDWRKDVFSLGLHARYLQDKFPDAEIGVSLPRLRPCAGVAEHASVVNDRNLAQLIMALRIFLPRLAISLSTRESPALRDALLPLGITSISAGSSTRVGGHITAPAQAEDVGQFEISDQRGVEEIKAMALRKGYQPVLKDWMRI